ncbi:MAG: hypothetical protein KAI81_07385 [Candidatus Marinimicrobia bacterium]|nr:hypothetical protein [Candidatus Neomarinimicrobiota bacterium]
MFLKRIKLTKIQQIFALGILMSLSLSTVSAMAGDNTQFRQEFYKDVEPIKLVDPLSFALGATVKGEAFVYYYTDIVKYSGHSCPSVAGAYKMTQIALEELYGDAMPIRGNIKVTMRGAPDDKVNGPIAQVISFITGAAGNTGFKGLKGKFSRYNLLSFESDNPSEEGIWAEAIFERMDTGDKVNVAYKVSMIPTNPGMGKLMPLVIGGKANKDQMIQFGNFWQERVKNALLNAPKGAFVVKKIK